jgi:hypothetical protein
VTETLPGLVAELVGQTKAARHDEAKDLVGQRRHRCLAGVELDQVCRARDDQLCLVGDVRAARRELESLAAIAVVIDVAVVARTRLPALHADAHARLETRSGLQDRRGRLDGVQPELAPHRERQSLLACTAAKAGRQMVDHLPPQNATSRRYSTTVTWLLYSSSGQPEMIS